MRKKFSKSWEKSKKTRKQRKYLENAPLHIKQKFMGCHLIKELRKKYNKRSLSARKGDKVKILRGQFKGQIGKIDRMDIKKSKIFIQGIEIIKKDGTKTNYPIHPSNVTIMEIYLDDKRRLKKWNNISKD